MTMMTLRAGRIAALVAMMLAVSGGVQAQLPTTLRFGSEVPPEVDLVYERGLAWLASKQSSNGSWEDGNSGSGLNGICLMAFLASGEDPNFGRYANTVRAAIRSIILGQDAATGYFPNSMYHHGFAMLALSEAYGTVDESLLWGGDGEEKGHRSIAEALDLAIRCSATSAKKNRFGAWRYSPDATDADTSVCAAMLMGLLAARNAGLSVPDETVDNAVEYLRRSTGRNGAVAYAGGFGGGESMNRSAFATLVYAVSRHKDWKEYNATLSYIKGNLEHKESGHPHYFLYYMAQALFQGDYESWQKWNASVVRQLKETQNPDGSFQGGSYATGMSLLGLALNYRFLPIYER
ncbi:MAG TPA: squalene--hopene cyclase [Verrucomicrobiales bacterium]|nr:squalene--hopene cyclase [Verrucomicrobiales bacterium]